MLLEVTQIPTSKIILIPVASQNMNTEFPNDIDIIKNKTTHTSYKVYEWFLYSKGEHFPTALFLVALGVIVTPEMIWDKYKESESIILFVCSEIEQQKEENTQQEKIFTLE